MISALAPCISPHSSVHIYKKKCAIVIKKCWDWVACGNERAAVDYLALSLVFSFFRLNLYIRLPNARAEETQWPSTILQIYKFITRVHRMGMQPRRRTHGRLPCHSAQDDDTWYYAAHMENNMYKLAATLKNEEIV